VQHNILSRREDTEVLLCYAWATEHPSVLGICLCGSPHHLELRTLRSKLQTQQVPCRWHINEDGNIHANASCEKESFNRFHLFPNTFRLSLSSQFRFPSLTSIDRGRRTIHLTLDTEIRTRHLNICTMGVDTTNYALRFWPQCVLSGADPSEHWRRHRGYGSLREIPMLSLVPCRPVRRRLLKRHYCWLRLES